MRRNFVNALSTVLLGAAFFAAASPVSEAQTPARRQAQTQTQAQTPTATNAGAYSRIKAFVDADVFLVARLDLAQIDLEALDRTASKIFVETLELQGFDANSVKSARREFNQTFNAIKKFAEPKLARFRDEMGLREVYFVVPRSNEPEWFVYAPLAKSKRAAATRFALTLAPSAPFEVGSGVAFGTSKFTADYFQRFKATPNSKLEAFFADSNATLQLYVGAATVDAVVALKGDDAAKAFAARLAAAPAATRSAVETFDSYFVDARVEIDVNALKTSARLDFASADAANKVRVGLEQLADVIVADVEKTLAEKTSANENAEKYNLVPVVRELFRGFLASSLPKRDGAALVFELQAGPTLPLTNPLSGALLAASGSNAVEAVANWRPDGGAFLAALASLNRRPADDATQPERDPLEPYVEAKGFLGDATLSAASYSTSEQALRALSDATNGFISEHRAAPPRYSILTNKQPAHSWRVHLLPFLGEQDLYSKIRLDEPWDSEHNRQFHALTPSVYRRPGTELDPNATEACVYSCVADKNSALVPADSDFDQTGAVAALPSQDGRPGAILYYERPDAVCWMDPNADGDVAFIQNLRQSENGVLTVRLGGVVQRFQAVDDSPETAAFANLAGSRRSVAATAKREDAKSKADLEFRNALTHVSDFGTGVAFDLDPNRVATNKRDARLATPIERRFDASFMNAEFLHIGVGAQMQKISDALVKFQEKNGALPARYSADKTGAPLHSWRVHLLPYFNDMLADDLYAKIRLDEPWDSEYNRQFHSQVPKVYRRVADLANATPYVCVYDARGFFTKPAEPNGVVGAPATFKDGVFEKNAVSDSLNSVLATVESPRPVCWMDPNADMSFETFVATVAASGRDGVVAVCLEGKAFTIPSNVDPALLGALVTRDGDEKVER